MINFESRQPVHITMFCLVTCLWALSASSAAAGEQELELVERLGQSWQRQLVTFDFKAERGACHRRSLRMTESGEPVALQLIEVETWPDAPEMVRRAKVATVADLGPQQMRRFTLTFGPSPIETAEPAADLRIDRDDDTLTLATRRFGVRIPVGEWSYDPPVDSEKAVAPVQAMRLADGTWFGGGSLYGQAKVRRVVAELTEAGPVLAEVVTRYEYADGHAMTLTSRLSAGDAAVYWDMHVDGDRPDSGWRLMVNRGLPPLTFPVQAEARTSRGIERWAWDHLRLDKHPPGLVTELSVWGDWFSDFTQTAVRLRVGDSDRELRLVSRDSAAWVDPAPMGVWMSSEGRHQKQIPLRKLDNGDAVFEINLADGDARLAGTQQRVPVGGARRFYFGEFPAVSPVPDPSSGETKNREVWERYAQTQFSSRRLEEVRRMVLHWPQQAERLRPRMLMTAADVERARQRGQMPAEVRKAVDRLRGRPIDLNPAREVPLVLAAWWHTGDEALARELRLADRLRLHLGQLGNFDLMRSAAIVAMLYDALIDTDLIDDTERPLLRAQMAYLAYRVADASTWSMERGYTSGNPNMSVSYVLGQGTVACALPDHPMAQRWVEPAVQRMNTWLEDDLGPKGEWMEGAHYDHVSGFTMLAFVVAAKHANLHDFSVDPRFKRLMLYIVKHYTPPDPTRDGHRVHAPLGRRHAGSRTALPGVVARLTAESDPEYARVMQWTWRSMGYSMQVYDRRLAGAEHLYLDRSLDAVAPDWSSELFPRVGALMRSGVGTEHEHYLHVLLNGDVLFARPSETGSITKWFAMGRPIGGLFTGGEDDRHELLTSRVLLARSLERPGPWRPTGYDGGSRVERFSATPGQDYFDARFSMEKPWTVEEWRMPRPMPDWPPVEKPGKPPVNWRRQGLYVKSHDPRRPGFLVLRDTVSSRSGSEPTMWQFWTLSRGIVTPEQAMGRDTAPADLLNAAARTARTLDGDRFIALGQFDVDLEYYIAAPRDTPRFTLRREAVSPTWPVRDYHETQDLLNIGLSGDGHYLVVMYPRWREEPAPEFTRHADGNIVRITTEHGEQIVLLAAARTEASVGEARFDAEAASIGRIPDGFTLRLGGPGRVAWGEVELESDGAADMRFYHRTQELTLGLPAEHQGTVVRLNLPLLYGLAEASAEDRVTAKHGDEGLELTVPVGVTRVRLIPE